MGTLIKDLQDVVFQILENIPQLGIPISRLSCSRKTKTKTKTQEILSYAFELYYFMYDR
jgi:hypothetical protein